jgi:acyl-CoA synthetase (AMP-forming)/AMP-acid ligase II
VITPWLAFLDTAARLGPRPAIVHGDRTLTFEDWLAGAWRYAAAYRRHGLRPGDRVLLWIETSHAMAEALFGAWAAGAIPVLIDPRSGPLHFAHAVRTAAPAVLVARSAADIPAGLPADAPALPPLVTAEDLEPGAPLPPPPAVPTDPASIVFTSGSTGRPKGVTQTHGNLLRGCRTVTGYLGVDDADIILCPVPWSFDYGFGQLLTAAIRGSAIVVPAMNTPAAICEAIERWSPSVFAGIPSVFQYLLHGVSPFRRMRLDAIRTVTNTGGTIPRPVLDELLDLFAGARIFLNYGLTETYRTSYLAPELVRERPDSIGRPIPGVDVVVLRDDGSVAGEGEEGEFIHRGDFVCLGYWNDPDATARARRPDPLAPAALPNPPAALFTGDYGEKRDGFLYFHGRRDHQLKSMGVRVNPSEVEAVLHASGLLVEAAVVGRKDPMIGDEICAFVVCREPATTAQMIGRYARGVMSPYMMPRRIVIKPALPRTTTGKVDYPALRLEADAPPAPAPVAAAGADGPARA